MMNKYTLLLTIFLLALMIALPSCYTKVFAPKTEEETVQNLEAYPEYPMSETNYDMWMYYQYREYSNSRLWTDYAHNSPYYGYYPYWYSQWSDYYYYQPYDYYYSGYYYPDYGYTNYGYVRYGYRSKLNEPESKKNEKKPGRIQQGHRYRELTTPTSTSGIWSPPMIAAPSQGSKSSTESEKSKKSPSPSKKKTKKYHSFDDASNSSSSSSRSYRSSSSSGKSSSSYRSSSGSSNSSKSSSTKSSRSSSSRKRSRK